MFTPKNINDISQSLDHHPLKNVSSKAIYDYEGMGDTLLISYIVFWWTAMFAFILLARSIYRYRLSLYQPWFCYNQEYLSAFYFKVILKTVLAVMSLHVSYTTGYCRMRIRWILYLKLASVVIYLWSYIPNVIRWNNHNQVFKLKAQYSPSAHTNRLHIFFEDVTL